MTPAARIAAAIEVVGDIETRHRTVADTLRDWGLSHRFAGSKDRSAIGNLVYDALRWRLSSAWLMGAETPRTLVLGAVGRHWGLSAAALSEMFAGSPHAPEALTADETERLEHGDLAAAPGHIRADLPEWLAGRFQRVFGDGWIGEGAALALRPPLDMRVNRLKAGRDKVLKELGRFGAGPAAYSEDGLRIAATTGDGRHPNVQVEPAFQKGWFEVQDEGSQIAAALIGASASEQVLDLCAGAGGKTLALASIMANKGQIFATDSDRMRLAPIFDRVKRSGARNIQVRPAGDALADIEGRMDAVLVDAPCTGTGVWRRRPDAKWRLAEMALDTRRNEQAELLPHAARFVKPGGRLVYVTCSLLPDENEDQIAAFAAAHPAFTVVPPLEIVTGSSLEDDAAKRLAAAALLGGNGIVLTPQRTETDGFFIAVLRRTGHA